MKDLIISGKTKFFSDARKRAKNYALETLIFERDLIWTDLKAENSKYKGLDSLRLKSLNEAIMELQKCNDNQ